MAWRIVAGRLSGNMTIAIGRTAWLCVEGDLQAPPEESTWIKADGVDFPAFGPPTPFFWLQGATAAIEEPDGTITGSLSREEAAANVTDEDPESLEESWLLMKSMLGAEALNKIGYEARRDPLGRISWVKILHGQGRVSTYEYTHLPEPIRILPPDTRQGRDNRPTLFEQIGN